LINVRNFFFFFFFLHLFLFLCVSELRRVQ
jgi:hypothetical protein